MMQTGADILAVDVGGTSIKAARHSRSGDALDSAASPTPLDETTIVETIAELCRCLRGADTVAVGVVVPGVVDARAGIARWAANLAWRELPLRDLLINALGLPVTLDHDVSAAALAESGETAEDLLFVSLGTGIAAGHVIGGQVWRGATGTAGEIGHCCVDPAGEPCACGQRGCLEVYASAAGIARRYAIAGGNPQLTSQDIASRLDTDPLAARIWQESVDALGTALANHVLIADPATIVLGGGLSDAGELLLEPVRKAVGARLSWRPAPEVRRSRFGPEAGLRGAAVLAWQLVASATKEGSAR